MVAHPGVVSVLHAARAIQAGDADVVACIAADVFDTAAPRRHARSFQRLRPGLHGAVRVRRGEMEPSPCTPGSTWRKHGATRADFGRLCVAQRENALLNPNALFKKPLTLQEYLDARLIAEPLRLFDCVHPCTGGDAVILANEKVAEGLDAPLVRILGGGEQHNYPSDDIYALVSGLRRLRRANVRPGRLRPRGSRFRAALRRLPGHGVHPARGARHHPARRHRGIHSRQGRKPFAAAFRSTPAAASSAPVRRERAAG